MVTLDRKAARALTEVLGGTVTDQLSAETTMIVLGTAPSPRRGASDVAPEPKGPDPKIVLKLV